MDQFMVNSLLCQQIAQQHLDTHMEAVRIANNDEFNRFMDESVRTSLDHHNQMLNKEEMVEEDPEYIRKFRETEAYIERLRKQIKEEKEKMGL